MSACRFIAPVVGALLVSALGGCHSVSSYAVPTGPAAVAPSYGAVTILATGEPEGGHELGIVEASGSHDGVGVDQLYPELIRRVQQLGGNALVLDQMGARFELVTTHTSYQQMMPCGFRGLCSTWQTVPTTTEEMRVVLRGRAWRLPAASGGTSP
ncbi:MAG: hypothetical protein EOO75_06185 [Myxococcales bacterium]|nr:MAG: hypothetical protein EOO75_06185 [Myxococcales bacterium]